MAIVKVFWTQTAIKQRDYILKYWNKRNGNNKYSKKLNHSIKERILLLKENPNVGKSTGLGEVRSISLGHYSILYRCYNSEIFIAGFWDNRQDPGKLLKFLKGKND